jgi:hypothetical protein
MNQIEKQQQGPRIMKNLGGLRMMKDATLPLSQLSGAPYVIHHMNRATTFIYNAGQTIYDLATLRSKLRLPAGWTYGSRRLTKPLRIITIRTAAEVLQDNLDNTYSGDEARGSLSAAGRARASPRSPRSLSLREINSRCGLVVPPTRCRNATGSNSSVNAGSRPLRLDRLHRPSLNASR